MKTCPACGKLMSSDGHRIVTVSGNVVGDVLICPAIPPGELRMVTATSSAVIERRG